MTQIIIVLQPGYPEQGHDDASLPVPIVHALLLIEYWSDLDRWSRPLNVLYLACPGKSHCIEEHGLSVGN